MIIQALAPICLSGPAPASLIKCNISTPLPVIFGLNHPHGATGRPAPPLVLMQITLCPHGDTAHGRWSFQGYLVQKILATAYLLVLFHTPAVKADISECHHTLRKLWDLHLVICALGLNQPILQTLHRYVRYQ